MKKHLLICLITISCIPILAQVDEEDSLALVALYNNTDGPNWTDHTNWLEPGQLASDWHGVYATMGRVVSIILSSNNLSGTLPQKLEELTELEYLNLSDNNIGGNIPSFIGSFTQLVELKLRDNLLTGEIPASISMLEKLEELSFANNDLTGSIPAGIGNLVNLRVLVLYNNQLTGSIPPQIGDLTSLVSIYLYENDLCDLIPTELGKLTKLEELYLYGNRLTGNIPSQLGNLTNLTKLFLSNNDLTGSVPDEICNLSKLERLTLSDNMLSGPLPSGIKNMSSLKYLYLANNSLTFSDLEALLPNAFTYFSYSPQRQIPVNTPDIFTKSGDDLDLDITDLAIPDVAATNNQYQWLNGGTQITSFNASPELNLSSISQNDQGLYHCSITNSDFSELTLHTDSVGIWVQIPPPDILLSSDSIDENVPAGTVVGMISVTDEDQSDGHVLSFATGNGTDDEDNSLFTLDNSQLMINASPDYETKNQYHIMLRATDNDANYVEKTFTISVNNLSEVTSTGHEKGMDSNLKLYPNPTSDIVEFDFPEYVSRVTIILYDENSQLLEYHENYKNNQIHLEQYPAGLYILKIYFDNSFIIRKVRKY